MPDPANKHHFIYEWPNRPAVDWEYSWDLDFDWSQFEALMGAQGNTVASDSALFFSDHGISKEFMSLKELKYIHNLLNLRYKCAGKGERALGTGRVVISNFRTDCTRNDIARYMVLSKWINTQVQQPQNRWISVHWFCQCSFMLKIHRLGWLDLVLLRELPSQLSHDVPTPEIGEWIYANPVDITIIDHGLEYAIANH